MNFLDIVIRSKKQGKWLVALLFVAVSFTLQSASCDRRIAPMASAYRLTNATNGHSMVFPAEGGTHLLQLESPEEWRLSPSAQGKEWWRIGLTRGEAGVYSVKIEIAENPSEEREFFLRLENGSREVVDSVRIIQQGKNGIGSLGAEHILGDIDLIELPRLSGRQDDYFVTHRVENGQRVNYSLEYNTTLRHARWVCFSFDAITWQINTERTYAWGWDPFVPTSFEVEKSDYKGYDRGHLVASFDRVYSREANAQTFYYTNMSPQRAKFNQVAWQQLERTVQDWVRTPGFCDKMYVAKGGTIRPGEYEGRLNENKIAIPKHYWMAVVVQQGSDWRGLAFWISHKKESKQKGGLAPLTCSIDELELRTGLDFFFNLPDEVEERVEAQIPSEYKKEWQGL